MEEGIERGVKRFLEVEAQSQSKKTTLIVYDTWALSVVR